MTRSQQIRALALGLLAKRPDGFGYPQDTLVAEVILLSGDTQVPEKMEVRAALDELVEECCVSRRVHPILGSVYYELTTQGRSFAPIL